MTNLRLTVEPSELDSRIVEGLPEDCGAREGALALATFLRERQPQLASAVRVGHSGERIVVLPSGERPLETLRAVQALLGVSDRLPGEVPSKELPEIEVDAEEFHIEPVAQEPGPTYAQEALGSRVRYFPHPSCEWFEISEGELFLTKRDIDFRPRWQITTEVGEKREGGHHIPLEAVKRFHWDSFLGIPCLNIETPHKTYRYGWASVREEPESVFDVDEWIEILGQLIGWKE